MVTEGLYAASAALLFLAGAQKIADPQPLVRALTSMRIALGSSWIRAGAVGEFLLGVAALGSTSRVVAGLVAASYAGFTDTTTLTVTAAVLVSISVTPITATIAKGTSLQYTATGTFADGSTADITAGVTWTTGSAAIATVTAGGLAIGVGVGTTTVRATQGAITNARNLTVTAATLVSIAVAPATATLARGYQRLFTATGTFSDGTTQNLTNLATWSSSNTTVARVSNVGGSKGRATARATGIATITASFGGKSGTATLTVSGATLTSIAVTPTTVTLAVGQTQQLTAIGTFSDGTTLDLTVQVAWRTSSRATANVRRTGLVTARKKGSATISATKSGVTGSSAVTVP